MVNQNVNTLRLEVTIDFTSHEMAANALQWLPGFDASDLKTLGEQRFAHKILAFLASQYVWHEGNDNAAEVLPAVIARPLMDVSLKLGCQPLLGHIDLVLSNCFPEESSMTSDSKPPPFIERTADIEITFASALPLIMKVLQAIRAGDKNVIEICLRKFPPMFETMKQQMLRLLSKLSVNVLITTLLNVLIFTASVDKIYNSPLKRRMFIPLLCVRLFGDADLGELDPQEFYVDLRKYLSGWSHGRLTKGLIYQGVPDDLLTGQEMNGCQDGRRIYLGASAAQSASLQTLDAFFGVKHGPEVEEFLVRMRAFMIRPHRQFVEDLERHSTLRDYANPVDEFFFLKAAVSRSGSVELREAFNACISSLEKFRRDHVQIVHSAEHLFGQGHQLHKDCETVDDLARYSKETNHSKACGNLTRL
ncbi:unnamed protein product [Dibothriocephalus latus]|uniref:Uncharacterized protein n=1 Tax=Dibothriocephalus latus TaxID=60516 RepID=A0A3P6SDQ1_DIBLA|nr:unnamed protein product [Dibothriocephalus latus]